MPFLRPGTVDENACRKPARALDGRGKMLVEEFQNLLTEILFFRIQFDIQINLPYSIIARIHNVLDADNVQ